MYTPQSTPVTLLLLLLFSCSTGRVEGSSRGNNKNAPGSRRGAEVLYAVNCGGDTHQDMYGVIYQKDPLNIGVASDFGLRMNIDRVHPQDEILYQTERYSPTSFGYEFPVRGDGPYVIVLKFSEVYFRSPNQKVFDVILNSKHKVVENLDIFGNVGYATAHDEIVPFHVTDNGKTLLIDSHRSSTIRMGRIRVDFVKGISDNPKINAFFVAKGTVEDIPHLPPSRSMDDEPSDDNYENEDNSVVYSEDDEDIQFSPSDLGYEGRRQSQQSFNTRLGKVDVRSGPPTDDPWEFESPLTVYMPLIGSVAASAISFLIIRVVNSQL